MISQCRLVMAHGKRYCFNVASVQVVPSIARVSTSSFPRIPECPLIHVRETEEQNDVSIFSSLLVLMHSGLDEASADRA